jgi:hypothetical protein
MFPYNAPSSVITCWFDVSNIHLQYVAKVVCFFGVLLYLCLTSMARGAQRVEASQRARSGVVEGTVVTLDRPVTQVRGPHGQLYNL